VLLGTVVGEHVSETHQRLACGVPDDELRVLQGLLEVWPELLEVRLNVEGYALDSDTESHDGRLAHVGVARGAVLLEQLEERREDV
jgi:hypothetical protein